MVRPRDQCWLVGDQDDRLAGGDVEQLGDQPRLGLRVQTRRGFVEQQYRAVTQQRPGNGDAALLAAGQSMAMLADRCVIAVWQVIGEGRDTGPFGGFPELPGSRTGRP